MKPPWISERDVERLITERDAFRLAEETFRLVAAGRTSMPSKVYLSLPGKDQNDFRAMPAYVGGRHPACGVKWVSVFPKNSKRGLPTVNATILLNSADTGELQAILAGGAITALRTAAAAAVATAYLGPKRPKTLAIVGAGLQARYQLRALVSRFHFSKTRVWGFVKGEAEAFCRRMDASVPGLEPVASVEACVSGADVVVTCTPSRAPIVRARWIAPGCHLNAIGADAKGKQELETAILKRAKVVVDDWEQASHSGEINVPVSKGVFSRADVHAHLAQVVSGARPGRRSDREITVFDSTGVGVLDLVFARAVFERFRGKH